MKPGARVGPVLAFVLATGCSGAAAPTPVSVVLRAQPAQIADIKKAIATDAPPPITPDFREAPSPALEDKRATLAVDARLAEARKSYANADAARCEELLEGDAILDELFAARRRAQAARVYFWRTACAVVSGEKTRATRAAEQMAVVGLDLPEDVARASVEVEQLVLATSRSARAVAPVAVEVVTSRVGADVSVDGQPSNCASPCRLSLLPGTHWVTAEQPGAIATTKRVDVRAAQSVSIELQAAPPAMAGQQWAQIYASSPIVESPASMSLLATSLRTRRLVYMAMDERGAPVLRGTLVADGEIKARGERKLGSPAQARAVAGPLFVDLLEDGKIIESTPLYKKPLFWIVVGATAIAASAITYVVLREPEQRTEIRF